MDKMYFLENFRKSVERVKNEVHILYICKRTFEFFIFSGISQKFKVCVCVSALLKVRYLWSKIMRRMESVKYPNSLLMQVKGRYTRKHEN